MEPNGFIKIAVAIIINKKNELLTVRKFGSTYYQLPGGKIESNERPVDTLIRELEEELGLSLKEEQCSFLTVHEAQAVNEKGKTVRGFVFRCQLSDLDKVGLAQAEIEEVRWVKPEETSTVNLANLLKQIALPILGA